MSKLNSHWPSPQDLLIQLCSIPSASKNRAGVNRVQKFISEHLDELNFRTILSSNSSNYGSLLCAVKMSDHLPRVTLVTHADTVREPKSPNDIKISDDKTCLLGPGVADDKGGIVVALSALRLFLQQVNQPKFQIEFVCSPNEEIGSPSYHSEFQKMGQNSKFIFGFEPSPPDGSIITSRHGNKWYKIEVIGKEAHTGRANGEEINAAHELCLKINEITKLKQRYDNIKLNISSLQSSHDKYNIVCGRAVARLDLRFETQDDRQKVHQEIDQILSTVNTYNNTKEPAITHYQVVDDCPPLEKNKLSQNYIDYYLSTLHLIEKSPRKETHGRGASDSCYLAEKSNAVVIDGLGPIGGYLHTSAEYVELKSLETRAQAFCNLLLKINQEF